ncbi:phosphodiesterase [Croceicoccus ponticola]|uniref:Phosphodiesterase n=1 Tax=Croceicoccus ponticola TaxID=2217664 RepID=A0A437GW72_9SPHN|nr:metallophosphoesterase [Croceicoccus ponticola]RVQ66383.1 phosphodiesterase [Croceicoccus ponticola]
MLIAQITDIHLGFEHNRLDEPNRLRFDRLLANLVEGPDRPDLLLLTGDLTEHGDIESFRALADAVRDLPFPVWPMPGNHDKRGALLETFPNLAGESGFIQYALDLAGLRIVMLDTCEPGRHGGAFCEVRADWLARELAAHRETPTLIAMHHPPAQTGIAWMDVDPHEPWLARLADVLHGQNQVLGIICGHLHRAIVTVWQGIPLAVCPSSAPALALDLNAIDPARPDNRALIVDALPAYALHLWTGSSLVTHFASLDEDPVLARFDSKMQPLIADMMAERP